MNHITVQQARDALYDIGNSNIPEDEQNVAFFLLEEFLVQMDHYMQTRNIMIPMLLQKENKT